MGVIGIEIIMIETMIDIVIEIMIGIEEDHQEDLVIGIMIEIMIEIMKEIIIGIIIEVVVVVEDIEKRVVVIEKDITVVAIVVLVQKDLRAINLQKEWNNSKILFFKIHNIIIIKN